MAFQHLDSHTKLMIQGRKLQLSRIYHLISFDSPGTDAAAGASAAFSACSALYNGQTFNSSLSSVASLKNTSYASTLLSHAESLFAFAVNATGGQRVYQDSVPQVADAYGSSTFGDELTIAALFLSWAANSSAYFTLAENYFNSNKLGGQDGVFNWDSKTPGISVLFTEILSARPSLGNISQWQTESERYFDDIINGKTQASMTNGKRISRYYSVSPVIIR